MSDKPDYQALINEYGVLPYLGSTGRGFAIQQRPEELSAFIEFCIEHDVKTVLELGSADGGLSYFMADALGWQVTSIDIVQPKHRHERVEFIQATTDAGYQFVQGRAFDLVFIDADHSYEAVKSDHERYSHLGRIVAFHDVSWGRPCCEGVERYWRELFPQDAMGSLWESDTLTFRTWLADQDAPLFQSVQAKGGVDAPGIGWYINPDFNPRQTRHQKYSAPLPDVPPDITVVTGTYNRYTSLKRMIESARASVPRGITLDFVAVDGGSTDDTLEYLRNQPDVTLIEQGELLGIKAAYRDGFDAATGRYVVTANDDIEFVGMCLWNALCYLETHAGAGGVAFHFDEPNKKPGYFYTNGQPMIRDGVQVGTQYAQVGMFRKWIGDAAGWWGGHDDNFPAKHYGLDNYLTSRTVELGYTVDAVKECQFHDHWIEDELRASNMAESHVGGVHPDAGVWVQRFNGAPVFGATPLETPGNTEHLRVLMTCLAWPYTDQFQGFLPSLRKVGLVCGYDVVTAAKQRRNIEAELTALVKQFKPHILFTQVHQPVGLTATGLARLRAAHPGMVCVNWNGDESLLLFGDPETVRYMQTVDLHLTVNPSLFPGFIEHGVNAAVLLDSYQDLPAPNMPAHDVVFCGNNYPPRLSTARPRQDMVNAIRVALPDANFGVYGKHYDASSGEHTYDYAASKGTYQAAKLAIVDNMYGGNYGYVSDRFYNALAHSQCVLMQRIDGLETIWGIQDGVHCVVWDTHQDLVEKITYYLKHDAARRKIGKAGRSFVREHHHYDARIRELFDLLSLVKKK